MRTARSSGSPAGPVRAVLAASPAGAAVQISQSGWQWGNPTAAGQHDPRDGLQRRPRLRDRRRRDRAAHRRRRRDVDRPRDRHLAGPRRASRRSRPDVVVVLGGDGCVVRRSDDGGRTFRKVYVLAETGCPDRVQPRDFVDPNVGYLFLARRHRPAHHRRRPDVQPPQTAVPGTRRAPAAASGTPADAIFTSPRRRRRLPRRHEHRVPHDRRRRPRGSGRADVEPGNVRRARAGRRRHRSTRSARTRSCTPPTAARPGCAAAPAAGRRSPAISCATADAVPHDRPSAATAPAHRGRRRHRRARSPPRPQGALRRRLRLPHPRDRRGQGGATVISDDDGPHVRARRRRHRGLVPVRAASSGRPRTSRSRSAPAATSPAPTDGGHDLAALNVATSADLRDVVVHRPPTTATSSTSAAALFRDRERRPELGRRSTPGRPRRPRAVITSGRRRAPRRAARHPAPGRQRRGSTSSTPARAHAAVTSFDRAGGVAVRVRQTAIVRTRPRPRRGRASRARAGPARRTRARSACATSR